MLHYLAGLLIVAGLGVDVYLCWVIGEKDRLIEHWRNVAARNDRERLVLQMRIPPPVDRSRAFCVGLHSELWNEQHLEIRGNEKSLKGITPLHVRKDGAVEIKGRDGVAIIIHRPKHFPWPDDHE